MTGDSDENLDRDFERKRKKQPLYNVSFFIFQREDGHEMRF